MNYNEIKKLDEATLQKLTEGLGPSDQCLCSVLAPPDAERGLGASIKKALGWPSKKKKEYYKEAEISIPFAKPRAGKFGSAPSKEVVKRKSSCGRCGCDKEDVVLKHTYANIRITSPDVSTICPCPSECLPAKEKLMNAIKVTIEHLNVDPATHRESSTNHRESSIYDVSSQIELNEMSLSIKSNDSDTKNKMADELINAQYTDLEINENINEYGSEN